MNKNVKKKTEKKQDSQAGYYLKIYLGAASIAMVHLTLSNVVNKNQFISLSLSTRWFKIKTQPIICYLKQISEFAVRLGKTKIQRTLSIDRCSKRTTFTLLMKSKLM